MVKAIGRKMNLKSAISTKENTKMIKNMDLVNLHGHLDLFTKDTLIMTRKKVTVKWYGSMDIYSEVIGETVIRMD